MRGEVCEVLDDCLVRCISSRSWYVKQSKREHVFTCCDGLHVMWSCGIFVAGAHDSIELSANELSLIEEESNPTEDAKHFWASTEKEKKWEREREERPRKKEVAHHKQFECRDNDKKKNRHTNSVRLCERQRHEIHTYDKMTKRKREVNEEKKKKTLAIAIKIVLGIFHWMLAAAAVEYFRFLFDRFFSYEFYLYAYHSTPCAHSIVLVKDNWLYFILFFLKKANNLKKPNETNVRLIVQSS